jgi:hypothetical protein
MVLPEFKDLRRKCRREKIKIPEEPYFSQAEEFVNLQEIFIVDSFFASISLWIDMIFYPLYVIYKLCMQDFSPMFIISLTKTYRLWIDWFRFHELGKTIKSWKETVNKVGGPWISTNDPTYHVYVYADGMERLSHSIKLLGHRTRSKKLAKSSK